ncbi:S8 family serine peptidase [Halpernia frigidisoli]|uniref:Serine protease, subtilisin family n=1 Tax=Halpernia frigidisoli TaxID=1125876 RepID=A0A1I3E748_9FLAO|nr:S8 family serine peptidase [Halpernia frigidisoli]SFH94521.1 Serine protease, subtilisin family [Halpernia frigidisoli]
MKKLFISALFLSGFLSFAQTAVSTLDPMQDKDLMTWYHKDFATSKVYGVNTANAYKFLESKGLKPKKVVVAVLDSGVQVDHPALKNNLWTNSNEIPGNGKDDDKNGYIDDVNGWDFIGGKDGEVGVDNLEITRVIRQYKNIFEGSETAKNKANQAKMPEEFAMYLRSKDLFTKKSVDAKQQYEFYSNFSKAIPSVVALLNGKNLTAESIAAIKPVTPDDVRYSQILSQILNDPSVAGKSSQEVQTYLQAQMKEALDYYEPQATKQYNLGFDPRSIVGDDYANINEKYYGNNHYEGPDALHGTHVAGIIAGQPNDSEIQYGVGSKVAKIMTIRAVPDGDERDKDIANGIFYAVNNGAKIVNMSFGKSVSPGKEKVWEAFKYAQDKGVLLVHAAGNDNDDLEKEDNYPTNFKKQTDEKAFLNNVITVGASTNDNAHLRADFSNYNGKMVDVFAPGKEIYSSVAGSKYQYLAGTSMASPVVAGSAAILLAYMPNLTPAQLIESFEKTVNKSTVNAEIKDAPEETFDKVSVSGGVIDTYKAAVYAYDNFYKKSSVKTSVKKVKAKKKVKK